MAAMAHAAEDRGSAERAPSRLIGAPEPAALRHLWPARRKPSANHSAQQWNTLVNFESALLVLGDQFSLGGNNPSRAGT